ncbi:MAG: DNA-directed RNA polymerase subunit alpha C-terminal domain-containing protein [Bacillus sp. (in: firmicutes)]
MDQVKAFHQKIKIQIEAMESELANSHHTLDEEEVIEKHAKIRTLYEMLTDYECMFAEELAPMHVKMSGKRLLYMYNDMDYRTIEQLNFTIRTYVILKRANYETAQQLREANLEEIPNISQKSIEEIKRKLNL